MFRKSRPAGQLFLKADRRPHTCAGSDILLAGWQLADTGVGPCPEIPLTVQYRGE
ncbi:hypothetical protein EDD95_2705 [Streptomyces sp. CEV 2-1]|nr:hypothetical protein EDD95_2705 [Streptomyces sp. CEV 2-1]